MLLILDYYIQTFALKVQASSHGEFDTCNLEHVFVGRSLFFCRL